MSITILVMINPLLNSTSEFFRQAHSSLEIRPTFRLIPRWIRLMIDDWRTDGYTVKLIFLALGSADEAIARVATRVIQGGHDIPEATIRRRFDSGRLNFQSIYRSRVDSWLLFDNSGEIPLLLEEGENA